MPAISVIMAVWGAEKVIEQSVASVLDQDVADLELILVDDRSPDRSIELAEALAARRNDDRLVVVRREINGGVSAARNTGLAHARGTYVAFIDNDDAYLPGCLSLLVREIEREPGIDLVVARPERLLADGRITEDGIPAPRPAATVTGVEAARLSLLDRISCFPWDKLYRRSLFAEIGFPDGILYEDLVVTTAACLAANKVRLLPDVVYRYATYPESQTWQKIPPVGDLDKAELLLAEAVSANPAWAETLALPLLRRRILMALILAQRAQLRPAGDPAAQLTLQSCRARWQLRDARRIARLDPFLATALAGFLLAPRLYGAAYRAYARRSYGITRD